MNEQTTHKNKNHGPWKSSCNSTVNMGPKRSLLNFNKYLMSAYYVPNTGFEEENRLELAMGIH